MTDDRFFWLPEPPTAQQIELYDAVMSAHARSANRGNISSTVLIAAAEGSGSLTAGLAAALNTLGGKHAPLIQTYEFLIGYNGQRTIDVENSVECLLDVGHIIPGWGNSFHKGQADPEWQEVQELLVNSGGGVWPIIQGVNQGFRNHGKWLYPNPSAYTAAAAIELRMPAALAPWLFVAGRLGAWARMFYLTNNQQH